MQRTGRPTPGYTLTELLVTLAVIALLVALLLPALAKARASGRSAVCKGNLRQLGLALTMYVHDQQNKYPHYLGPAGPAHGDAAGQGGRAAGLVYWSSKLFPYRPVNWTNRSFHCPGYRREILGPYEAGSIERLGSYAYNAAGVWNPNGFHEKWGLGPVLFWRDSKGNFVPPVSADQVSVPGEMVAVGDSLLKVRMRGGSDFGQCNGIFSSDMAAEPYVRPHGQEYNQVFCDGHVSSLPPGVLFNPTNSAALWNYDHQSHPELWTP